MGRPRPKPSPRPAGDDGAPDPSATGNAAPRPTPRPGPTSGTAGRGAPRTGPVGGLPTPPSGFASPVRPAVEDDPSDAAVADTPAPAPRPLFGSQATSTGWPDFRSTGSGMFGAARTADAPDAAPAVVPGPSASADATARLAAAPPAEHPAPADAGPVDDSGTAPAPHPGPGDSGPAGGFTDAEPTSLTHAGPVDDAGTAAAPHPGPGDSGPAGGFTEVPTTDVGPTGTHPAGPDPVTVGPAGDDLFAPTPAPAGTGSSGITGAEVTGTGVTSTEVTGPIPVVRDPSRPAPAPIADARPVGDTPENDIPQHDIPQDVDPHHDNARHDDPQPIVPGLIDPRPVLAGEDTAAAADGRITTEPDQPEPPASTPIGEPVARPDQGARREAVARVSELAVPVGGLGSLAELGCWLAACQGECPPRPPVRAHVLLVAADHGIAAAGVSAYPPDAGRARAVAAAEGRLPIAVTARSAGAALRVVDVGLVDALDPYGDAEYVVARGSGRIDTDDALTEEQAERAYVVGQLLADAEIDAGADVLVPGTLAVAATTPAAVLVAALTGAEPVAVVGRGSGIDDRVWMRKATVIRDALRRGKPYARKPLELLRRVAGADIVVLAGLLARAADRKVPVVIDGLAVGAAALLAEELAPGAREWWLAAQASSEPAMVLALDHLSLTPVLDLGIRTDDGTAAVATLPLLVTAARLVAETGTAADTGISPLDNG